jgi:replicative DNA helicase
MLKGTAEVQAKRTNTERFSDSELYNNVIEQVYGPHWKGGQFSERDENSWLFQYANEMGVNEVERIDRPMTIGEVEAGFTDFVRNIDANTIKTGIWELDQALPITVGMNLGVIAAPGAGKTALALEILRNTSQAGVVSVFASLDMHRTRLFEKLLYKVSGGMERKDLYKMFQDGKGGDLTKKIKEQYGNVYFFDRSAATVEKIRDYVLDVERESGKKVKLVMIDYFERVLSDMSDETAASKNISGQVQDMVNDLNVCGITLVQPNKQSLYGGPDAPILSYTAIKGSSFLYQSFRSIISLWRPFMSPENKHNNKYMQMAILKNDLGELDMFDFKWTGKTGSIEHLEDNEHAAFIELLKEKDRKKNEKEGW